MSVPEAPLRRTDAGLVPAGPGWFVVNAREAAWSAREGWGSALKFEAPDAPFADYGINVRVVSPGEPSTHYHGENAQEDFLILHGECIAVIEGEERPLKQWDFVHTPAGALHGFVGAGTGPCAILQVGARKDREEIIYPVDPVAQKHGISARHETTSPKESYAGRPEAVPVRYQRGWLGEEG